MDLVLVHLDMLAKSSSSGELKPKFGINLHKIHSSGQPFLLPNFGKAICALPNLATSLALPNLPHQQ